MKKLFNKALMYQNYHSGRWPLIIGTFIFGIISYFTLNTNLMNVNQMISMFNRNTIDYIGFFEVFLSWGILTGVYFFINGVNKKSSMSFLQSGPFSKREIKQNQIITLFISLIVIILVYIYIFLCLTYKNQELIVLIPNYYNVFIKDIIRFFVSGMAFISYLIFMDMIFSNAIIEIFAIVVIPFLVMYMLYFVSTLYFTIMGETIYNVAIIEKFSDILQSVFEYVIYNNQYSNYINTGLLTPKVTILIILAITIIMFIASCYLNKYYKMNNSNKVFNFNFMQQIFEYIISLNIVLLIVKFIVDILSESYLYNKTQQVLLLILVLFIAITIISSWFISKLIDNYLKKYL